MEEEIELIINNIKDIKKYRLDICHKCPIYSDKYGGICNNKLWLNVETNDVSITPKPGYQRGCGCLLDSKVDNVNASCPLDKW